MASNPLKVSLLITADGKSAAAEVDRNATGVSELGRSADRTASSLETLSAANDRAATAGRQAMAAAQGQANAQRDVMASIERATGLTGGARSTRAAQADIEAYGRELDQLRARYNPLFAAGQKYRAELAGIRRAHQVGAISADEMNAALARAKSAFAGQVTAMNASGGALQLNQQQLMNMQFQMNDMAVMLASGQSPFVLMMQQGMQIGQMFGPGATVRQALKATGAGIVTFLTNPINLAIAGTAALAGGAGLIWDAFTGEEAKSAEDLLSGFDDLLQELEKGYEDAARAARNFVEQGPSRNEMLAGIEMSAEQMRGGLERELDGLRDRVSQINEEMFGAAGQFDDRFSKGEEAVARLVNQLTSGKISVQSYREELAAIYLDPQAEGAARDLAAELLKGSSDARELEKRLKAAGAAAEEMARRMAAGYAEIPIDITLGLRLDQSRYTDLSDELESQARALQAAAEREAREAEQAAREAARKAAQHEANRQTIADIEAEIAALSAGDGDRERLLDQLRIEQEIRSAIAGLGPDATQQEIEDLQRLIPVRERVNALAAEHEEQLRRDEQAADRFGSTMASITQQLLQGADAGEVLGRVLLNIGASLLQNGFSNVASGTGIASLISAIFQSEKGNVFRAGRVVPHAKGDVVSQLSYFPMANGGVGSLAETEPEAIMPLRRGPNGRLGVENFGAAGGGIGGVARLLISLSDELVGRILEQAKGLAVDISSTAVSELDAALPIRFSQIANDPRAR